jgi:type IV pilus assembly protein PilA
MNTTKNRLIQKLLLNKKAKKLNGFTLVELMVVIVIVGILTAVGLPQLQKSQDKAKSIAAKALAVNAAKDCATELIFTTSAFEVTTVSNAFAARVADVNDLKGLDDASVCEFATTTAGSGEILAAGGGDTWTVTIDSSGIPSLPTK